MIKLIKLIQIQRYNLWMALHLTIGTMAMACIRVSSKQIYDDKCIRDLKIPSDIGIYLIKGNKMKVLKVVHVLCCKYMGLSHS